MDKKRVEELAQKWMLGTITPEEKAEFRNWYENADDGLPLYLSPDFAPDEVTHGMRMYRNILERNRAADKPRQIPFFRNPIFRYAVAAMVVIAAGIYLFQSNGKNGQPAEAGIASRSADVKPPNTVNAVITLADGTDIVLDSIANGKVALKGNVQLTKLHDGQIVYQPVAGGEVTYNTLTNPRGSKVIQVTLADGTRVWLNSESSIRYPTAFTGKTRAVEVTGETYFEVTRNPDMPFRVKKENMEVVVLGTHFNMNTYEEEEKMEVTLLEGAVEVFSDGKNALRLHPGEQSQLNRSGDLVRLKGVDIEGVMAWKNGKFDFGVKSDIGNIMRQIARWYNLEVEFKGNIDKHFGGSISRDVNLSQVLKVLETTGDVRFQVTGKKILVMP